MRTYKSSESQRAASKKWREANLEKVRAKDKAYRIANAEKRNEYGREWRRQLPPKMRAAIKERIKLYHQTYKRKWEVSKPVKLYPKPPPNTTKDEEATSKISLALSQTIQCEFCELSIRKGSDAYFDGRLTEAGFACGECSSVEID